MILEMNAEHPQPRRVDQVAELLAGGELAAYPTDSVYAIGCDSGSNAALAKLQSVVRDIKGAPDHAPLSILCRDLSQVAEYASLGDYAFRTMRRLLPGPYTMLLPASKRVPSAMRKSRKTIGVRVPDSPIALALIERIGRPLITTSAAWGDELIADPWTLRDTFGASISVIVDGGYIFPEPTTVLDFTEDLPRLVRRGKGSLDDIEYIEAEE